MKWIENGDAAQEFHCSHDKANIFLIGDSIRRGYCSTVRDELCEIAEVFYPEENCRNSQFVITRLKKYAGLFDDPSRVTLVQFNSGQWDAAHWNFYEHSLTSEDEYARNILAIIRMLRQFFPNAKLVFATTSPMNPDGLSSGSVNPRSNEEIDRYNRIAVEIATKEGVTVNDINGYMRSWESECFTDLCHLTRPAFVKLGQEVARRLRSCL